MLNLIMEMMWRSCPPQVAGQGNKRVGKSLSHLETSVGKKRKEGSIEYMTDAIMEFMDMSMKRHSNKDSDS